MAFRCQLSSQLATNALGGSSGHQRTPFLAGVQLGLNFFGKVFCQHCIGVQPSILFLTKICAILFTLLTLSGAVWGLLQRSKFRILCDVYCCTGEMIIPRERELDNFSLPTTTLKKHCVCNQIIVSQFIVAPTKILIHFHPQFWFLQKKLFRLSLYVLAG